MRIAVCAKQVPDPDIPPSRFKLDSSGKSIDASAITPVVNGFDLNAIEAAVRIKESESGDTEITIISAGTDFALDVMKKALATGSDELVLVDDPDTNALDAAGTAKTLAAAIEKSGPFDLILCGRQASDWDQAHVPLMLAEHLDLPCITVAQRVEASDNTARIERVLADGFQEVEVSLPAVVTVSNELGEPRYPALRGIMMATRKQPTTYSLGDLGLDSDQLTPLVHLEGLEIPVSEGQAELIEGDDDSEKGRNLAIRLREEGLV